MKSKILPLVLLFVFLLALLLIGRPLLSPDRGETGLNPEKEKDPIVIYEPKQKEWSKEGFKRVSDWISEKQKEFSALTRETLDEKSDPELIGEAYGEAGFLTAHNGKIKKGKKEIIKYFSDHSPDIANLKFKIEFVYATELTHNLNLPPEKREKTDVNHVVYFIISYSFNFKDESIDPPSGSNWRHIRMCEWEPDI